MNTSLDDEPLALRDPEDAWEEIYDEPLQVHQGGIRNYYYRSCGKLHTSRPVLPWLKEDQARLTLPQTPVSKAAHLSSDIPPEYSFEFSSACHDNLPAADFTRFLEILPGSRGIIECRLHVAGITSMAGHFEALSYASEKFRNPTNLPTEQIVVGGATIDCRNNLVQFLRRLRLPERRRVVWCPHLCVNLDNHVERNNHTRMASLIYSSSHRVVVWLGQDSFKSPGKPFASMCKVVNVWRQKSGLMHLVDEATFRFYQEPSPFGGPLPQKPSSPSLEEAWTTLVSFFSYPNTWFCSIWSLLEIVSAKDAIVMLGDSEMLWEWVGLSASILRENHCRLQDAWHRTWRKGREPEISNAIVHAALMYRLCKSQSYWAPAALSVDQLFPLTAHFFSTHDQDQIYVLLGVASDNPGVLEQIPIDYTQPIDYTRHNFATAVLGSGRLEILARIQQGYEDWCMGNDPRPISFRGPSWCPQKLLTLHEPILPTEPHPSFSASRGISEAPRTSSDGKTLSISAVLVDKISMVRGLKGIEYFWRGVEPARYSFSPETKPRPPQAPGHFRDLMSIHELEALKDTLRPGITANDLQRMAITLTCGKDWYGCPVTNIKQHTADYVRSILRQGPKWSLTWAVDMRNRRSPSKGKAFLTAEDLLRISEGGHADRFLDAAASVGHGRAYFETEKGLWGLGPDVIAKEDQLCIIQGIGVPFIIRPCAANSHLLMGECYVYDMMHGEVAESLKTGANGLKETLVHLV